MNARVIILTFCLALVASQGDTSGIKVDVDLKELSTFLNTHSGILSLLSTKFPIKVPDYAFIVPGTDVPVFEVNGAKATRFGFRSAAFTGPQTDLLDVQLSGVTFWINANISFGLENWLAFISVSKTDVHVALKMSWDSATGKPGFAVQSIGLTMQPDSIDFHDEKLNNHTGEIISFLEKQAGSSIVLSFLNNFISSALSSQTFQVDIMGLLKLDLLMPSAPQIVNDHLTLRMKGDSYLASQTATKCKPFRPSTWSATDTIQVLVNVDMLNCLIHTAGDLLDEVSTFVNSYHPMGLNLTATLEERSALNFGVNSMRPQFFADVLLGQQNAKGDFIDVELAANATFNVEFDLTRHDLTGITANVTAHEESIGFEAKNFRGDERFNPTHQNFGMISQMLSAYIQKFLPLNQPKFFSFDLQGVPSYAANLATYNFGTVVEGLWVTVALPQK